MARGWLRALLRIGLAGGLILLMVELGARIAVPALRGPEFARGALRQRLLRTSDLEDPQGLRQGRAPDWSRPYVLHPYLGFVRDPKAGSELSDGTRVPDEVNAWGFFGPPPLAEPNDAGRGEDPVRVAILGGSLAMELYLFGRDALAEALAVRPGLAGRDVELVSLALEGMKQPQQLLALQYLLALGAEFDWVVNLDGFNEVVLPLTDNHRFGVAVHYPRAWPLFASRGLDLGAQIRLGQLAGLARQRRERAAALSDSKLRNSAVALLVWSIRDAADAARSHGIRAELRSHLEARSERRSLQETGPPDPEESEQAARERGIELWQRGSRELARLSANHGAGYLHVLQPNQYFARGRSFTEWERENALALADHDYRSLSEAGYPGLVEGGRLLAEEGVPFLDATAIFANEPETVYRDKCCHLNSRGYGILARAIAVRIGD